MDGQMDEKFSSLSYILVYGYRWSRVMIRMPVYIFIMITIDLDDNEQIFVKSCKPQLRSIRKQHKYDIYQPVCLFIRSLLVWPAPDSKMSFFCCNLCFYFALKCRQCNQMHQSGVECGIEYGRCIRYTLIYTHSVYIYTQ